MRIHPSRQKWLNKRLLWLGGIAVVLLIIGAAIKKRQSDEIQDLIVTITDKNERSFLSEKDVIKYLKTKHGSNLIGHTIGDLKLENIEQILRENLYVEEADVYIDAQQNLNVKLSQRTPMIRVMQGDGTSYYLDLAGNFIPAAASYAARVPVVTGNTGIYNKDYLSIPGHTVQDIYNLAKFIKQDMFLDLLIEQVYIDDKKNFYLVPKVGDFNIAIGTLEDLDGKVKRIKAFFKEGLPYAGWNKYKTISVRFKGQIVAVKR